MDWAKVVDGKKIVIEIEIANLETGMRCGPFVSCVDPDDIDGGLRVTDEQLFAEEVVRELNSEEEDGETLIHRLLDTACERAIEAGAEGVHWPAVDDR